GSLRERNGAASSGGTTAERLRFRFSSALARYPRHLPQHRPGALHLTILDDQGASLMTTKKTSELSRRQMLQGASAFGLGALVMPWRSAGQLAAALGDQGKTPPPG